MYKGILKLKTAPTEEILTAADIKQNSRIDSETYADNITQTNSIDPAQYSTGTQTGAGVDISAAGEVVALITVGGADAGAVLSAYLEDSDDGILYESVTGSTFGTFTTGQTNEKSYDGTKQYIRVIASNSGGSVTYSALVQERAPASDEDAWINQTIQTVRQYTEQLSDRAFLTQSWYYYLDRFPDIDFIDIPRPPLQTINSIQYTDKDNVTTTLTTDYYNWDTAANQVYLEYNKSWPCYTEKDVNSVVIDFTAGSTSLDSFKLQNYDLIQHNMVTVAKLYEDRELSIEDAKTTIPKRNYSFK